MFPVYNKLISDTALHLKNKLSNKKIQLNLDALFFEEYEELKAAKTENECNELYNFYKIPFDIRKIEEFTKKHNISPVNLIFACVLYDKLRYFPDDYYEAEESFHNDYYEDMVKIRELLKQSDGKSPLFIKIDAFSEKIDNKNGWFSHLLKSFIDDYVHPDESYYSATKKKVGRRATEVKRKYYQYLFYQIISIGKTDNIITNSNLRCLKELMEELEFTFNIGDHTENEFLKVMRTEILEIEKKGCSYNPIYIPKYYDKIDYVKRNSALKSGTTYTSIDLISKYKHISTIIHKYIPEYILDKDEDEEEKEYVIKRKLYQMGKSKHNPDLTI